MSDFVIEDGVLEAYNGPGGDVVIPEGVTAIGEWAFCECDSLTSILIPGSVTSIGDCAFYRCDGLTSIQIPESVTSIGCDAFSDCDSLTSIQIPEGVTSIGSRAFYNCENLTSIQIPKSITSIEDVTLYGCYKLSVIIAPGIPIQTWEEPMLAIPACMGYLTRSELYQDPESIAEYREFFYSWAYEIICRIFKDDLVQGLAVLDRWGGITPETFESAFFKPAQRANAMQCVAYLLDWKNRHFDSEGLLEKEFEL